MDLNLILGTGLAIVLLIFLVVALIIRAKKKNQALAMLALRPDAARIYTLTSQYTKQTLQRSIGLESGVVVKKIDGQDCPFIADQSGGFTPVIPGTHTLQIEMTSTRFVTFYDIKNGEIEIQVEPYQCLYLSYDKKEDCLSIIELGYTYQLLASMQESSILK